MLYCRITKNGMGMTRVPQHYVHTFESERCYFEVCSNHPLYYCITFTRSSLSCLLTFYGIPIILIRSLLVFPAIRCILFATVSVKTTLPMDQSPVLPLKFQCNGHEQTLDNCIYGDSIQHRQLQVDGRGHLSRLVCTHT